MTKLHFWPLILDLSWLFVLVLLISHFWHKKKILLDAKTWLQVKGRITRCDWTQTDHSAWPKIEYLYIIQEQELLGEYLFLDTFHNNPNSNYSRRIAYKAAIAFQKNAEIDIYYNPNHPEQSALDVTIPLKLNLILGLLGFFIVIHCVVLISHYIS